MTLLKIARMGHPGLRRVAEPVADPRAPAVRQLAADMLETMVDAEGVGLAAPQVHQPLRLIVLRVPPERQGDGEPAAPPSATVLVNPELEPTGDDQAFGLEGCLSIPDLRGLVPRHTAVRYRGVGLDGQALDGEAFGFHARVLQHEVDHLDGVLFLDRMPDLRSLVFSSELHHLLDELDAGG